MKNILITGEGSFIGISVQRYLDLFPDKYCVTTIGTKNEEWKKWDFSSYDSVYHVAGLAHSDVGNVDEETKKKYLIPGFSWALKLMSYITGYVNKAFGNLCYEEHLGDYKADYRLYSLAQSIKETEG